MKTGQMGQAESAGEGRGSPCVPTGSLATAFELTMGTFETTAEGQPLEVAQQQAALRQLILMIGQSQAIRVLEQYVEALEQITLAQARGRTVVEVPDPGQIHGAAQVLLQQEQAAQITAEEPEPADLYAEDVIELASGVEEL